MSWCRSCASTYSVKWLARNPGKRRQYQLKTKYGLTDAETEELATRQNHLCAICRRLLPSGKGRHIDHDHVTGRIRALLCSNCNMVLGLVHDEPEWLERAATYLRS